MREIRQYGSVRGVAGNRYPYRDSQKAEPAPPAEPPYSDDNRNRLQTTLSTHQKS